MHWWLCDDKDGDLVIPPGPSELNAEYLWTQKEFIALKDRERLS